MPRTRKPPEPPETYTVAISPNNLELILGRALQSATAPLYEEIAALKREVSSLREQQSALVEEQGALSAQQQQLVQAFEQMQRNHTEQLQMLANSARQLLAEGEQA